MANSAAAEAYLQEIRASKRAPLPAGGNGIVMKAVAGMSPADPAYRDKIPPGEPDSISAAAPTASASPVGARCVVLSYGPTLGSVIVGVGDVAALDVSVRASKKSVRELLPVLRALGAIIDLTAGGVDEPVEDRELPTASRSGRGARRGRAADRPDGGSVD